MASNLKLADFKTDVHIDWCPGCGDFGVTNGLQQALLKLGVEPHRVALFSGIGCSGKFPHYFNVYGYHTLHGRVLPYAIGCKLANPNLTVVAIGGDGDGMGIGGGHFVNSGRRNVDITYIMMNNGVYGLTKGQASPTLDLGMKTRHLTKPNINQGMNPILLAVTSGYTFVARTYSYNIKHMVETFMKAIQHPGMAFVDVLQGCPTYNDLWTPDFYLGKDRIDPETGKPRPRLYNLQDDGWDPYFSRKEMSDAELRAKMGELYARATEFGERIAIGIFYVDTELSTYEERIEQTIPNYRALPPALRRIADEEGRPLTDIRPLLESLRVN